MTHSSPLLDSAPRNAQVVGGGAGNAQEPAVRERPFSARQWALLAAITAVAVAVRMFRIGEWPLWVDEAHTWRDVTISAERFWDSARAWYPTSYLLLRGMLSVGLLPDGSEAWLRLPFALAGSFTVPLLALYGRSLVGRNAALLAAAILCVHPWHVYWSQNARAYALVAMFAVFACGEFWRAHVQGSRARLAASFGFALLAASCQPTGTLLLPALACAFLALSPLVRRNAGRLVALAAVAGVLIALPSLLWIGPFRNFAEAKWDADPSVLHLAQTVAWHFRVPLLVFAAIGLWSGWQGWTRQRARFLLAWAVVPLLLLALLSLGMVKVTARYAFLSLPGISLLAAVGAIQLGDALSRTALSVRKGKASASLLAQSLVWAMALLDSCAGSFLYFTAQRGDRAQWDDAVQVATARAYGAPIVAHTTHEPVLQYYMRPGHWRGTENSPMAPDVRSIERIDIAFAGGGDAYVRSVIARSKALGRVAVFLVALPELREKDADGSVEAALARECELAAVFPTSAQARDETIYVYCAR